MINHTAITINGEDLIRNASDNLTRFIQVYANAMKELVGFGWEPSPTAPNEYTRLRQAHLVSQLTGKPLPVSDQYSDDTIYDSPATNYAFRFLHDITHIRMNQNFDLDGEITVSNAHLDLLAAAGWGPGTLEHTLLYADTAGQTVCGVATGQFPADQACFARRVATSSLGDAIRAEFMVRTNGAKAS